MRARKKRILLGILLTITNVSAAIVYGPLLWEAWGDVSWTRVGVLLLAGALVSTLMNVWSLILRFPVPRIEQTVIPSAPGTEAGDV